MPYIEKKNRSNYDSLINLIVKELKSEIRVGNFGDIKELPVGDVNYIFSSILWKLFKEIPKYHTINDIVGVLECIKLEFYRRQAVDYEQKKIVENGDIET